MLRDLFGKEENQALTALIDDVIYQMNMVGVDSPEYPELLGHLERLNELKTKNRRQPLDRNTVVLCLCNLGGILVIVAYEQKHIFASKASALLLRLR